MLIRTLLLSGLLLLGLSSTAVALEEFNFPTTADTWEIASTPYWWHVGDTVYGTYVTTAATNHAEISFNIVSNNLTGGGHCDLDFRIDGTTVGSFSVTEASGMGPITAIFDFTEVPAGSHELRYYETNLVGSGLGSFSIDDTSTANIVAFTNPGALENTTWGAIKASM